MQSYSNYQCQVNERLRQAVTTANYEQTLNCLMEGAKATYICTSYGRSAVGTASLVGDAEILQLLIQSCEEPHLDIFKRRHSNSFEMDIDITPDGMDNLEWEDEFCSDFEDSGGGNGMRDAGSTMDDDEHEHTSLYYYYAKTFELTGSIITNMQEFCGETTPVRQDPHTIDIMLMTPLHYAAAVGHLDCARILLQHGAPVNALNSDGCTPLMLAAEFSELTRLLLKHGANPNLKALNSGETALHIALRVRNIKVAHILLTEVNNINVNITTDNEQTALMYYARYLSAHNPLDIASLMIKKGARVNLQDKDGYTVLYFAVQKSNIELVRLLLQHGARRVTSHYLVHYCVCYNLRDILALLLEHGESLNVHNKDGFTPIMLAIFLNNDHMLEYLFKLALKLQPPQGKSIADRVENELLCAVEYVSDLHEFITLARLIFTYGDVSWLAEYKTTTQCLIPFCQTPLSRAIMLTKYDIAEFLIREGADISQICTEHVGKHLRTKLTTDALKFSKFLAHVGFPLPFAKLPFPRNWRPERIKHEEEIRQSFNKPLSLQAITRNTIRRHLVKTIVANTTKSHLTVPCTATIRKYQATKTASTLMLMIKDLYIPTILKTYLIRLDDCPTVMKFSKPIENFETYTYKTDNDNSNLNS